MTALQAFWRHALAQITAGAEDAAEAGSAVSNIDVFVEYLAVAAEAIFASDGMLLRDRCARQLAFAFEGAVAIAAAYTGTAAWDGEVDDHVATVQDLLWDPVAIMGGLEIFTDYGESFATGVDDTELFDAALAGLVARGGAKVVPPNAAPARVMVSHVGRNVVSDGDYCNEAIGRGDGVKMLLAIVRGCKRQVVVEIPFETQRKPASMPEHRCFGFKKTLHETFTTGVVTAILLNDEPVVVDITTHESGLKVGTETHPPGDGRMHTRVDFIAAVLADFKSGRATKTARVGLRIFGPDVRAGGVDATRILATPSVKTDASI